MENLKNTINKTEDLKNKVKLAKGRINETIMRGGGIASKSLSEIPDNIKSMISENYKKIAIIKPNKTLQFLSTFGETDFVIDTNLNFNPSLIILVLQGDAFKKKINVISTYNYDYRTPVYETNDNYSRYIKNITNKNFTITATTRQEESLTLLEYIAIE